MQGERCARKPIPAAQHGVSAACLRNDHPNCFSLRCRCTVCNHTATLTEENGEMLKIKSGGEYVRQATRTDLVFRALSSTAGSRFMLHALVCRATRKLHYPYNRVQTTINRVLEHAGKGKSLGELGNADRRNREVACGSEEIRSGCSEVTGSGLSVVLKRRAARASSSSNGQEWKDTSF